jgi:hypothetical protein
MLRVRFEPTTSVLERAKIFHTLDRAATVSDPFDLAVVKLFAWCKFHSNIWEQERVCMFATDLL